MRQLSFKAGFSFAAVCLAAGFAAAQAPTLSQQVQAITSEPGVSRAHWGVAVTALDGTPIYGMNEGQLFQPASNNKLFTTATAIALLGPEKTFTTRIVARGTFTGTTSLKGDVAIIGAGDANLSGRAIPYLPLRDRPKKVAGAMPVNPLHHLAAMADTIAASGLKLIDGDILGDDTLWPWEPYPADWSIDDSLWYYGAPVSALTINDNAIGLTVAPGINAGDPATVVLDPNIPAYYRVDASGLTTSSAKSGTHVQFERMIGSRTLRIYGTIATDAPIESEDIAIEDPAEYAAIALKGMLEARGIRITGHARAKHRLPTSPLGFTTEAEEVAKGSSVCRTAPLASTPLSSGEEQRELAQHVSVPVIEDITVTNKISQNQHAEFFLHHLGKAFACDGSGPQGAGVIRGFLTGKVGIDPDDFIFFDGSGLSGHDLVTPRALARLLTYATTQPWFAQWKKTLPIGGVDGSLIPRFPQPPLKEKVFAKTGTLGEARALSGYVVGASGKTVIFSVMVNNHTPRTNADMKAMDRIVAAIAATN